MWFKSVKAFRFEQPFELTPEALAECLEKGPFSPCTAYAMMSQGWFPPMGQEGAALVHAAGHYMMLSLKVQDKILPASVVKEQLDERCQALAAQDGVGPKGRQKQRLKEEIYNVLLPKALTKSSCLHGVIDKQSGWLWINTSSDNKADAFLSALREVLGSLPVVKVEGDISPSAMMTSWLRRAYTPEGLTVEDTCVMNDTTVDGGVIRCKRQDLHSQNIQSFLRDGCEINQLALSWQDQVSFVMCHDFTLKQLRFLDAVQDVVSDIEAESPEQQFDADFVIMTQTLSAMMVFLSALLVSESASSSGAQASVAPEIAEASEAPETEAAVVD